MAPPVEPGNLLHQPPLRHPLESVRSHALELGALGFAVALAVTAVISLAFGVGHP